MSTLRSLELFRAGVAFARGAVPQVLGVLAVGGAGALVRAMGEWTRSGGLVGIGSLVEVVAWIAGGAAMTRLAFADEHHPGDPAFRVGPQGFQWGRPEWRFLGANFVIFAAAMLAVAVPMVAALVLALPFGAGAGEPSVIGSAIVGAGLLVGVALAVFLGVRLSMAPTASIAERRLTIPWAMTKEHLRPLLGTYLLVVLAWLLTIVVLTIVCGIIASGAGGSAEVRQQAAGTLAGGLAGLFVQLPLTVGAGAAAYRRLRGGAADSAETRGEAEA